MGQKSNPNSFNTNSFAFYQNSFVKNSDYKFILAEQSSLIETFIYFFEKNTNSFVSYASYFIDDKNNTLTFVLSFLDLRQKRFKRSTTNPGEDSFSEIKTKLTMVFNRLGYGKLRKNFIFQNLNKVSELEIKTLSSIPELSVFKFEPYYTPAIYILALSPTLKQINVLMSKFILKYLRLLHRNKRCNLFFHFLTRWVEVFVKKHKLKGIKIQIKGRFQGDPRSSIKVFQAGQIPLQTIKAKISYSMQHVCTSYGVFGVKVWIYKK